MTSPASSALPPGLAGLMQPSKGLSNKGTEQRDQYLFLLTTQLKNQDPLNPQKPEELTAQLATFSQLEQLINLGEAVQGQSELMQNALISSQSSVALAAVGRSGQFAMPSVEMEVGPGKELDVIVPANGEGTLVVTTANGDTHKLDLGYLESGRQDLTVPAGFPAQVATVSIEVAASDGHIYEGGIVASARVSGVRFAPDGIYFRVGDMELPLGALLSLDAEPESDPNSTP